MISLHEALHIIQNDLEPLNSVKVNIRNAYGMILAEDVVSDIDMPPFNKSAMDGYAVRSEDCHGKAVLLKVVETVPAGYMRFEGIGREECVRIMTGAPVPVNADSVVMIEETEEAPDGRVKFSQTVVPGQNICRKGEDIRKNETVLRSGTILQGPEIAILSTVGRPLVRVIRKPVVGILSTGNEIVEPEVPPADGKIRNSNGPMLVSLANAAGCEVEYLGIGSDDEAELKRLIDEGLKSDVLLISGGVSVGDYDLIPGILKQEGVDILFHKVRVKPGKPLLFAKKKKTLIFGIPGNPVSNFTAFNLFIKPALLKLMGMKDNVINFVNAAVLEAIENKGNRVYIIPSYCRVRNGRFEVTPFRLNGSADIFGCSGCNCLIMIGEDEKSVKKGEDVRILLLNM